MEQPEEIDDLKADFARLKSEIASELRRMGGGDMDSVDRAMQLPARDPPYKGLSAVMPPMPRDVAASMPQSVGRGAADDDDDDTDFSSLQQSLLGRIRSDGSAAPAAGVPLMQPSQADRENIVRVSAAPRGGGGVPDMADRSSAAAILSAQQLAGSRKAAAAKPRVTAVAAHAGGSGASIATVSAESAARNSVILSARRPGGPGGATILAATDTPASVFSAGSNSRPQPASGLSDAMRGPAASAMAAAQMRAPVEPPEAFPFNAPPELEPLREESDSPSNDIMFGSLALKAALDSHRAHYEAARSKLPTTKRRPTLPRTTLSVK
jgi:hypothetical protein